MYLQSEGGIAKDPLTHREALMILERLYDLLIEIDHVQEAQPDLEEDTDAWQAWYVRLDGIDIPVLTRTARDARMTTLIGQLSAGLRIHVFLETR